MDEYTWFMRRHGLDGGPMRPVNDVPAQSWPNAMLSDWDPHYTDRRFANGMRTIYNATGRQPDRTNHEIIDGLSYVYSDRLYEWDYSKSEKAARAANDAPPRSAAWASKYLSAYFNKSIEVRHILAGYNLATGYGVRCFGYVEVKSTEEGGA